MKLSFAWPWRAATGMPREGRPAAARTQGKGGSAWNWCGHCGRVTLPRHDCACPDGHRTFHTA
jgi:hypothetical protein